MNTTEKEPITDLEQFGLWLKEGQLPDVRPSHQPRSIRTAWQLVNTGEELLSTISFDTLAIEEVCARAGTTVGGFYGRFENKQAFFQTMQKVTLLRSEMGLQVIESGGWGDCSSLKEICLRTTDSIVNRFRQNRGVIRACLQHKDQGMWEPFRERGDRYRTAMVQHLGPYLTHLSEQQRTARIYFAHQSMIGMLVHAILNAPRGVSLDDKAMVTEMAAMLTAYLSADDE